MRDSHSRVCRVNTLPARTACTHNVNSQVFLPYINLCFFRFWQHSDSYRTCVNTPRSFSFWNSLNAVSPRLISQAPVHIFARNRKNNFLETAKLRFVERHHLAFPTFRFRIMRVHFVQVGSKQSRFLATRTATNFHNYIFFFQRVRRNQQKLQLIFACIQCSFQLVQLSLCHLTHFDISFIVN